MAFSINNGQPLTIRGYELTNLHGLERASVVTDLNGITTHPEDAWLEVSPFSFGSNTTKIAIFAHVQNRSWGTFSSSITFKDGSGTTVGVLSVTFLIEQITPPTVVKTPDTSVSLIQGQISDSNTTVSQINPGSSLASSWVFVPVEDWILIDPSTVPLATFDFSGDFGTLNRHTVTCLWDNRSIGTYSGVIDLYENGLIYLGSAEITLDVLGGSPDIIVDPISLSRQINKGEIAPSGQITISNPSTGVIVPSRVNLPGDIVISGPALILPKAISITLRVMIKSNISDVPPALLKSNPC